MTAVVGQDKMMPLALLLACFAMISSGCFTPQFMPASNIECRIFDDISKQPIKGAELFMVYVGAHGQSERRGPFVTNEHGVATITVKKEALWQSGAEAGFAGGLFSTH